MNQILCIAIALIVGLLSTRIMKLIGLPNVTGYLITGIIIGPYVLGKFIGWNVDEGSVTNINNIYWISEVALGFIAFSIGSSFKFSALKNVGKRIIIITIFEALGGALLVFLFLSILKIFIPEIPFEIILTLSAIACATAPAATLMVIKQYKAKGPLVNTLLPVVAFDDAVALITFAILFTIAKALAKGSNPSIIDLFLAPVASILASLLFGALLGYLLSLSLNLFKSRANRMSMSIAAILVSVGVSLLPFSEWLHFDFNISGLLSSMMIGAVLVNARKDTDKLFERMEMFTPPIFILFFVISGAKLDITIFSSSNAKIVVSIALVYLFSRAFGKWIGAYSSAKLTKAEPSVTKYLGLTLAPQAGVAIGLATSAASILMKDAKELINIGKLEEGNNLLNYASMILAIILVSTFIYELVGPSLTKLALKKAKEIPDTN